MIGPISLVVVITISILITRIAAIALVHTGVSRELAKFQARSAFTGAGFTTEESEKIVNHPVRRRIIMWLMFLGNAGIVTGITSLILTFVGREQSASLSIKIGGIAIGLAILWLVSLSDWVDQRLSNIVSSMLKRFTELNVRDYASLMHLTDDYRLVDMRLDDDDWVVGKTLGEASLHEEGIVVLSIERRDDTFLGTPQASTKAEPGDRMILYGRVDALKLLDERRKGYSGDVSHQEAMAQQQQAIEEEERRDEASKRADLEDTKSEVVEDSGAPEGNQQ